MAVSTAVYNKAINVKCYLESECIYFMCKKLIVFYYEFNLNAIYSS